ncbi:MAG TPA: alanine--glyoxylate aminotransferase family protein [Thermomicrobiaceae bacterium]|nr:alanine--glyoxylate aminotransferase family protein [Thermomicrobiaceae bacterium]
MAVTDLRIPGPTPVPPAVMRAMQREMIPHRGAAFRDFFGELLEQVKRVHGTSGDAIVLPGTGSAGWEASIVNTLSPGDTVVAFVTGDFGDRFARVAARFGLNVVRVETEWGQAATLDVVLPALEQNPAAKAVLYTYNETSTGVANPLIDIGPKVREHGALLIVDGVSAVAGLPLEMDDWGVDIVLSGSQKAWMCPPGLVILGIGDRVWDFVKESSYHRFFWDFEAAAKQAKAGNTPTTAPLTMLYALKAACDMIEAEGLDQVYARHERLGRNVRDGLESMGFRLLADPEYASPTVTAAFPPEGLAAPVLIKELRSRHGIDIAGGQAHLRESIIRIGHMGWTHEPEIERTLSAIEDVIATVESET